MGSTYFRYIATIILALLMAPQNVLAEEPQEESIVYVEPTYANYAKTYWRLKKFDVNDDAAVDNFMKITECDLYKEFAHNEFEWRGIRQASRNYLEGNKKNFPVHFRFVQPISLGEYDFERGGFRIAREHAMNSINRFRMPSDAVYSKVCMTENIIPNYPKSLALELTRPFTLDFFTYDEVRAKELIKNRMAIYENLKNYEKGRKTYLNLRQVYMVTKVKMFAYKPGDLKPYSESSAAKVLGIMQSMEIYADRELTELLYQVDYRRKKKSLKKDF